MTIKNNYISLSFKQIIERFRATYQMLDGASKLDFITEIHEQGNDWNGELNKLQLLFFGSKGNSHLCARDSKQPILSFFGALLLSNDQNFSNRKIHSKSCALMAISYRFEFEGRYSISAVTILYLLLKTCNCEFDNNSRALIQVILTIIFNADQQRLFTQSSSIELNSLQYENNNINSCTDIEEYRQALIADPGMINGSSNNKKRASNFLYGNFNKSVLSYGEGPLYWAIEDNETRRFLKSFVRADYENFVNQAPSIFLRDDRDILAGLSEMTTEKSLKQEINCFVNSVKEDLKHELK